MNVCGYVHDTVKIVDREGGREREIYAHSEYGVV
jgi:hypothetical protein